MIIASVIIAVMTETVRTSETSVGFYQTTRRRTPEDSNLYVFVDFWATPVPLVHFHI